MSHRPPYLCFLPRQPSHRLVREVALTSVTLKQYTTCKKQRYILVLASVPLKTNIYIYIYHLCK